jgi:CHAT domain-containing protein
MRVCGTVLLGACDSGMADRIGRDERAGFVRAAIRAGAAAVVVARWPAENEVGTAVLDQFERYLRYLPRDVALQRALLDVRTEHPARWGCWALYGDPGRQTGAGPVRRVTRRHVDQWRNHARVR